MQGPHARYCGRQGGERKGQRDKMQDLTVWPLIGECLSKQYGIHAKSVLWELPEGEVGVDGGSQEKLLRVGSMQMSVKK